MYIITSNFAEVITKLSQKVVELGNPDPIALGGDVTYSVAAGYEDTISDIANVTNIYKFELKGANSFEQTIQSSRDNGTTFFEQVLTVQLKKQDVQNHKTEWREIQS